jgi:uncharacterized protein (TIGR02186 family)
MKRTLVLWIIFLFFTPTVQAKSLISDISDHLINIDSNFTGTDVLLFGARNDPGDIVVVIRGPHQSYMVRKKERVAGIWVNREQVRFDGVSNFYTIASSKPLQAIRGNNLLSPLGIGITNLSFSNNRGLLVNEAAPFKEALMNHLLDNELYLSTPKLIPFIGEVLFRVVIRFPENIPRGAYTAETYLINNGQLLAMQSTPIIVRKTGFDAYVFDMAHDHSTIYGLLAISMALSAGWLAGLLFRKI